MTPRPNWPKMPLVRNLRSQNYLIYDDPYTSKYLRIRGVQDSYGIGIYTFSIYGSNLLYPNSKLLYEFVDYEGNIIKTSAVRDVSQLPSLILTFEVNNSIIDGIATLTVAASSIENNRNRDPSNLLLDVVWQLEIRVNKSKDIDFDEIVAVDDLQYSSASVWCGSGAVGTSSDNSILLSWESMYDHIGQSSSHADGDAQYVSNFDWKHIEKYYIYAFYPYGTQNWIPENPYPASGSVSGNWVLHGAIEAPRLSSSQFENPTRSIYYFAGSLPNDKHISFWVGTSTNRTLRMKSNKSTQMIPFGIPSPSSSDEYWSDTSGTSVPNPD